MKEQRLRDSLSRTKFALDFAKFNEHFDSEQAGVNGFLIKRYKFPSKRDAGINYELFLVSRRDKIIITDQGRTFEFLDKIFELREPDVIKNLNAIIKHYNVSKDKDDADFYIPLDSWQNEQAEEALKNLVAKGLAKEQAGPDGKLTYDFS